MQVAHLHGAKGNAGDTVIPDAVMKELNKILPEDTVWHPMNIRKKEWTQENVDYVNEKDLVVIGAGGLLINDTVDNSVSDWQWDISSELIKNIKKPIIVHSIGFNAFRGHRRFNSSFEDSLNTLIDKSLFFSLRHSGGIEQLKGYIKFDLHDKINMHFCPTLTHAPITIERKKQVRKDKTVGILFAGDRLRLRHEDIDSYCEHMSQFIDFLKKEGYKVYNIIHMAHDEWFYRKMNKDFDGLYMLEYNSVLNIYRAYKSLEFVVGDRGHSQMIPFSLGCKVIVPISHNKLKWFFEDVEMSEYGVEENDSHLSNKLIDIFENFNEEEWEFKQKKAMDKIKAVNDGNLLKLTKLL